MSISVDPANARSDHELDASPWLRVESTIMATARQLRGVYDDRMSALDLNLTQASFLAYVAEFGAHSQVELAERLGLGRAAAGTVVDQLERRELVVRTADPDDRRVWRIELTDTGRRLVSRIVDIDVVLRDELRVGIPKADRLELAKMLVRLQENVAAAAERTTADLPNSDQPNQIEGP